MQKENTHPTHPIRNFFYALWSLANAIAYVAFFYVLATPSLPYRSLVAVSLAAVLAAALAFGFICPLFGKKRR